MSDDDLTASDAALFARLRGVWTDLDPVPADLVDRMVAVVAVADLTREYEMLTLVETAGVGATRGDGDTLTLQFSDGEVSVLLHVSAEDQGLRRIDGWIDAEVVAAAVQQEGAEHPADSVDGGRFSFTGVAPGIAALRLMLRRPDGELRDVQTPRFEA